MTLNIDAFRNAVRNQSDGYIRLDSQRQNVKTYATNSLVRGLKLYTAPTCEQNLRIRQQFYDALMAGGELTTRTVNGIRQALGISERGRVTNAAPLDIRTAKQVLAQLDMSNRNRAYREALIANAFPGGEDPWGVKNMCRAFIGLDNKETSSRRLQSNLQNTLEDYRNLLIDQKRDELLATCKMPAEDALRAAFPDNKELLGDFVWATQAGDPEEIAKLGSDINRAWIDKTKAGIGFDDLVKKRVDDMSQETGVDCSALGKSVISYVNRRLEELFTGKDIAPVVQSDGKLIEKAIHDLLAAALRDKLAMAKDVQQAVQQGRLSTCALKCLNQALASNKGLWEGGILKAMLNVHGDVVKFVKEALAHGGDLASLLKALDGYKAGVLDCIERELSGRKFEPDPERNVKIHKVLFEMAKADIIAELGEVPSEQLENLKSAVFRQTEDVNVMNMLMNADVADFEQQDATLDFKMESPGYDVFMSAYREQRTASNLMFHMLNILDPDDETGPELQAKDFSAEMRNRLIDKGFIFQNKSSFTPVNQHLSLQFQEEMLKDLNNRAAVNKGKSTEEAVQWAMKDFERSGTSLTLDGQPYCHGFHGGQKSPDALVKFFNDDRAHGNAAAKYIMSFLGQGLNLSGMACMKATNELACDLQIGALFLGHQKYDLSRTQDGAYVLTADLVSCVKDMYKEPGGESTNVDPAHSAIHQSIKLEFSFDADQKVSVKFLENPCVRCDLKPASYNGAALSRIQEDPRMQSGGRDLATTHYNRQPGFCDPAIWEAVKAGNMDDAFRQLEARTYSPAVATSLARCGLTTGLQNFLQMDILGNGRTLTAALAKDLVSADPARRKQGLADFQELCAPLKAAGLMASGFKLHPELLRLADRPDIIGGHSKQPGYDDFSILCAHVNSHLEDEGCQKLLAHLASAENLDAPETKQLLAPVLTAARRGKDLEVLLRSQLDMEPKTADVVGFMYRTGKDAPLNDLVEQFLSHGISDADALARFKSMAGHLFQEKQTPVFLDALFKSLEKLKLSGDSKSNFTNMACDLYAAKSMEKGFDIDAFCENLSSPTSHVFRALRINEVLPKPMDIVKLSEVLDAIDEAAENKTREEWGNGQGYLRDGETAKAGILLTYEKFVLQDLMLKNGGQLPTAQAVRNATAAPGNWYDVFMSMSCANGGGAFLPMVNAMPPEKREAFVMAVKPFGLSSSLNLVAAHIDEIAASYRRGELTPEKTWEICWGEPMPEQQRQKLNLAFVDRYFEMSEERGMGDLFGDMTEWLEMGYSLEDACKAAKGEEVPFQQMSQIVTGNYVQFQLYKLLNPAEELDRDLYRNNFGYQIPGPGMTERNQKVPGIAQGPVYTFYEEGTEETVFDIGRLEHGKSVSSITKAMLDKITAMCGAEHVEQIINVCGYLAQGGLATLRARSKSYQVFATEHSQAVYTIRKEGANVIVHVENPENCPLKFSWDITLGPQGEQTFVLNEFGRQPLQAVKRQLAECNIPLSSSPEASGLPLTVRDKLVALENSFHPTQEEIAAMALEINQARLESLRGELVPSFAEDIREIFEDNGLSNPKLLIEHILNLTDELLDDILPRDSSRVLGKKELETLYRNTIFSVIREKYIHIQPPDKEKLEQIFRRKA